MTRATPTADVDNPVASPQHDSDSRNETAVDLALAGDIGGAMSLLSGVDDTESWQTRYNAEQLRSWQNGHRAERQRKRIAIVSLLFNWPSQGGGTIHTAETGKFLQQAGYEVQHFYACYAPWEVGVVTEPTLCPATPIAFDETTWNAEEIRKRFRAHLRAFAPDFVIVTDSWNTKPLLCEAASDWPYVIRLAAMECICPLNNVRLLFANGTADQCDGNQLADSKRCGDCLAQNRQYSGSLHRDERALADVVGPDYPARLRTAFAEAAAVLAVNDEIAALAEPFSERVEVVPSGFDARRFPDPTSAKEDRDRVRVLFAGVTHEVMKGFSVLRSAAELLWSHRRDFVVVATGDNNGSHDEFVEFAGWQSQAELPQLIADCDILVFPTIAQDALGRTAVEAMAMSVPVVASRLGGLKTTVLDGETGLLFEPGDPVDLARKLEALIDDPAERQRLGANGRKRFEEDFDWDIIVKRHYEPLFGSALNTPPTQESLSCV